MQLSAWNHLAKGGVTSSTDITSVVGPHLPFCGLRKTQSGSPETRRLNEEDTEIRKVLGKSCITFAVKDKFIAGKNDALSLPR